MHSAPHALQSPGRAVGGGREYNGVVIFSTRIGNEYRMRGSAYDNSVASANENWNDTLASSHHESSGSKRNAADEDLASIEGFWRRPSPRRGVCLAELGARAGRS